MKIARNPSSGFVFRCGTRLPLICAAAAVLAHAGAWTPLKQKIINESGRARTFTPGDGGAATEMVAGFRRETHSAPIDSESKVEAILAGDAVTVWPGQTLHLFLTRVPEGGRLVYEFQDANQQPEWAFELTVPAEPAAAGSAGDAKAGAPAAAGIRFQYVSFPEDKDRHGLVTLDDEEICFAPGEYKADGALPAASAPGGAAPAQVPAPASDSPEKSLPPSPPDGSSGSDSDLPKDIGDQLAALAPGRANAPLRDGATHIPGVSPNLSSGAPSQAASPNPGSGAASQAPSPNPGSGAPSQAPSPDPASGAPGPFPPPAGGGPAQGPGAAPQPDQKNSGD